MVTRRFMGNFVASHQNLKFGGPAPDHFPPATKGQHHTTRAPYVKHVVVLAMHHITGPLALQWAKSGPRWALLRLGTVSGQHISAGPDPRRDSPPSVSDGGGFPPRMWLHTKI